VGKLIYLTITSLDISLQSGIISQFTFLDMLERLEVKDCCMRRREILKS